MISGFMTRAARRMAAQIIILTLASAFSYSCKTHGKASDVTSSVVYDRHEKLIPDYTPRFLDVDAGTPQYATSAAEVTKVTPPKNNDSDLGLTKAQIDSSGEARYFYSLYAWQGVGPLNLPSNTHVFAVFLRVDGRNIATDPIQYFTISWDAADGEIGVILPSKPGHNYSLQETYQLREKMGFATEVRRSRIAEITKGLYDAAYAQYARLFIGEKTGNVFYKLMDDLNGRQRVRRLQPDGYINCQHAVTDIVARTDGTLVETGMGRGFAAADLTYAWLSPHVVSTDTGLEVIAQRMFLQNPIN